MTETLNVIALVSGGKDSFFSILHCLQNGHNVVALGNLYPLTPQSKRRREEDGGSQRATEEEEHDLNSFLYQTVGHTVVPLYEEALGIPLYRQPITGAAIQTGTSYSHSELLAGKSSSLLKPAPGTGSQKESDRESENEDETESLLPLLRNIMARHPNANALSTGAILSTYQRTRIESVALRLGLMPLAYLWKYPVLPPRTQVSLLQDMQSVALDARIVKVASGGLNESFLWENVASTAAIQRLERWMGRFGTDGDGGVLGEGGEFETLVIDGPSSLFRGRIVVEERDRTVVREGGGSEWLRIRDAKVVMKTADEIERGTCRIPDLLERRFQDVLNVLNGEGGVLDQSSLIHQMADVVPISILWPLNESGVERRVENDISYWTIAGGRTHLGQSIVEETGEIMAEIQRRLNHSFLDAGAIVFAMIVLRSMQYFAAVNKVYGALFAEPNPPARVTISCGEMMPKDVDIMINLTVHNPDPSLPPRKALHVQSRSYWAPANIGPYSQAISLPMNTSGAQDETNWTVAVAGQIPLIPNRMVLPWAMSEPGAPEVAEPALENFKLQTVLALQHLWRVGEEMDVRWWTSAVAYLPRGPAAVVATKTKIAGHAWSQLHDRRIEADDSDSDEEPDLWEQKHHAGLAKRGARRAEKALPDWSIFDLDRGTTSIWTTTLIPPFFAAEVEELPRQSQIEWHAHLGVVNGPLKHHLTVQEDRWAIYQCAFGQVVQSVIMIYRADNVSDVSLSLREALGSLGIAEEEPEPLENSARTSYVDISITEGWDSGRYFAGAIPCASIWDATGRSVAAVLLFNTALCDI